MGGFFKNRNSRVENSDQLIHINSWIFPTTQTVDFFGIFFVDFLTHLSQILPCTILTLRRNQIRKNSYLANSKKINVLQILVKLGGTPVLVRNSAPFSPSSKFRYLSRIHQNNFYSGFSFNSFYSDYMQHNLHSCKVRQYFPHTPIISLIAANPNLDWKTSFPDILGDGILQKHLASPGLVLSL